MLAVIKGILKNEDVPKGIVPSSLKQRILVALNGYWFRPFVRQFVTMNMDFPRNWGEEKHKWW